MQWDTPQATPLLADCDVHLWAISLDELSDIDTHYRGWLAPHEQARAMRLALQIDRQRFIRAHVVLRAILATYTTLHPAQLLFAYNPFGKPYLHPDLQIPLQFSITHSAQYLLCAVTRDREVGVDLERIDIHVPIGDLAGTFFTHHEQMVLQSLPLAQRQQMFFRYWTRKEAIVKAHGMGLSLPLDSFDVAGASCAGPWRIDAAGSTIPSFWSLLDISWKPSYAAALAIAGEVMRVRPLLWSWQQIQVYPVSAL